MQPLLDYIFPNKCLSCSDFLDNESDFCAKCWSHFSFIKEPFCTICSYQFENTSIVENQICLSCRKSRPGFDFARCLLKYDESNKKLIHNFKYYDKTLLAKPISKILASKYFEEVKDVDLVIPTPMYKGKRIVRLYNHSQILANEIGSFLQKDIRSDILLKIKNTKPQSSLNKESRLRNLQGSIEVQDKFAVKGKRILLVDDVMTTGTTASLCAKLLKKAGALEVILLCIARRML